MSLTPLLSRCDVLTAVLLQGGNSAQNVAFVCFTSHSDFTAALSLQDAMFKVLMLHGDTDTNAAICGYIMGALKGFDGIPEVGRALVCLIADLNETRL